MDQHGCEGGAVYARAHRQLNDILNRSQVAPACVLLGIGSPVPLARTLMI